MIAVLTQQPNRKEPPMTIEKFDYLRGQLLALQDGFKALLSLISPDNALAISKSLEALGASGLYSQESEQFLLGLEHGTKRMLSKRHPHPTV